MHVGLRNPLCAKLRRPELFHVGCLLEEAHTCFPWGQLAIPQVITDGKLWERNLQLSVTAQKRKFLSEWPLGNPFLNLLCCCNKITREKNLRSMLCGEVYKSRKPTMPSYRIFVSLASSASFFCFQRGRTQERWPMVLKT